MIGAVAEAPGTIAVSVPSLAPFNSGDKCNPPLRLRVRRNKKFRLSPPSKEIIMQTDHHEIGAEPSPEDFMLHYRELALRQAMMIQHMRREIGDIIMLMNQVVEVRAKAKPVLHRLLHDESFEAD